MIKMASPVFIIIFILILAFNLLYPQNQKSPRGVAPQEKAKNIIQKEVTNLAILKENKSQEEVLTSTLDTPINNSSSENQPISKRNTNLEVRITPISPIENKTAYSEGELVNLPKTVDVPLQSLSKRTQSFYVSYERFQLGEDWDKMATKLNTTSSQASMNVFSAGYLFPKYGLDGGGGVDVLYIQQESITLIFPVLGLKVIKDIDFPLGSSWSLKPSFSLFFTPLPIKGVYGGKINLPISYNISKRLSIYTGLGYVRGQIFGQKKISGKVDPNVPIGGASALIGVQLDLD